jgi:hypothetical protein
MIGSPAERVSLMQTTIDWLLLRPAYVEHQARLGLLGERTSARLQDAHCRMIASPGVQSLVKERRGWPVSPLNSHKSAGYAIHKLTSLADLGRMREVPGIEAIARRAMAHDSTYGPFQIMAVIGPTHGG